ncbi:hypothetical protein BST61_g11592 [Cercospora zeina]
MQRVALACAALAALISASPAPVPQIDVAQLAAATPAPSGPDSVAQAEGSGTATLFTSVTVSGVATAQATGQVNKRAYQDPSYSPYYPALATHYTTDPALAASKTTTAGQACVTQPEAGTYCGFINPLDPCAPQPDGYGPVPTPDTASAFLAYAPLHKAANAAPTTIPSANNTQYEQVFKDLNASVQGSSYLGIYSLKTYDAAKCASICDQTDLCTAFNIFAERDPSLNPTNNDSTYDPGYPTVWGQNCPNPPSMTSFRCSLFGSNIDSSMATNTGQKREQFQIVITASDGYDKTNVTIPPTCTAPFSSGPSSTSSGPSSTPSGPGNGPSGPGNGSPPPPGNGPPPPGNGPAGPGKGPGNGPSPPSPGNGPAGPGNGPSPPNNGPSPPPPKGGPGNGPSPPNNQPPPGSHCWNTPENCHSKGINAPKYHMGGKFFPGPFNPQVCSNYALLQNAINAQAGKSQCQMFNAQYLHKNGWPFGTYCSLFSTYLNGNKWGSIGTTWSGKDQYECKQSWTYSFNANW